VVRGLCAPVHCEHRTNDVGGLIWEKAPEQRSRTQRRPSSAGRPPPGAHLSRGTLGRLPLTEKHERLTVEPRELNDGPKKATCGKVEGHDVVPTDTEQAIVRSEHQSARSTEAD
jgi:hypothetical protein